MGSLGKLHGSECQAQECDGGDGSDARGVAIISLEVDDSVNQPSVTPDQNPSTPRPLPGETEASRKLFKLVPNYMLPLSRTADHLE